MSQVFRKQQGLTIAQLTHAWGLKLAQGREDTGQLTRELSHTLCEDILNGRLDEAGPLRDDRRLGVRVITPDLRAGYVEGRNIGGPLLSTRWALDYIVVMKEAVLDFANRRQLPAPSWWSDSADPSAGSSGARTVASHEAPPRASAPSLPEMPKPGPGVRQPKKRNGVIAAMREDILKRRLTVTALRDMLEKELASRYKVSRDTARLARESDSCRKCR